MKTKHALWLVNRTRQSCYRTSGYFEEATELECSGFTLFGYWASAIVDPGRPSLRSLANCFDSAEMELIGHDYSRELQVRSIDVKMSRWPSAHDWPHQLEKAFQRFIEEKAVLAWCSDETGSPSTDDFVTGSAHGNVYAAYDSANGMTWNAGLDDEIAWLDDEQLTRYQQFPASADNRMNPDL